jgi:hypothetical protein
VHADGVIEDALDRKTMYWRDKADLAYRKPHIAFFEKLVLKVTWKSLAIRSKRAGNYIGSASGAAVDHVPRERFGIWLEVQSQNHMAGDEVFP